MTADFWGVKSAGGTATAYHLMAAVLAKHHALQASPVLPADSSDFLFPKIAALAEQSFKFNTHNVAGHVLVDCGWPYQSRLGLDELTETMGMPLALLPASILCGCIT